MGPLAARRVLFAAAGVEVSTAFWVYLVFFVGALVLMVAAEFQRLASYDDSGRKWRW